MPYFFSSFSTNISIVFRLKNFLVASLIFINYIKIVLTVLLYFYPNNDIWLEIIWNHNESEMLFFFALKWIHKIYAITNLTLAICIIYSTLTRQNNNIICNIT